MVRKIFLKALIFVAENPGLLVLPLQDVMMSEASEVDQVVN